MYDQPLGQSYHESSMEEWGHPCLQLFAFSSENSMKGIKSWPSDSQSLFIQGTILAAAELASIAQHHAMLSMTQCNSRSCRDLQGFLEMYLKAKELWNQLWLNVWKIRKMDCFNTVFFTIIWGSFAAKNFGSACEFLFPFSQ